MNSTMLFHPEEMRVEFLESEGCLWVAIKDDTTDILIFIGHIEFKDAVVRAYEKSLGGGGER